MTTAKSSISETISDYGPLFLMAGIWEGKRGNDIAPSNSRGTKTSQFRERTEFVPLGLTQNHEQNLWGFRFVTTAWRLEETPSFHEEIGYWLWDPKSKQVMKSFSIPRGITVIAGGTVNPNARSFAISAVAGSSTYGICSNQFLEDEFKILKYELKVSFSGDKTLTYESDTQIQIAGKKEIFHHTDKNVLTRVS